MKCIRHDARSDESVGEHGIVVETGGGLATDARDDRTAGTCHGLAQRSKRRERTDGHQLDLRIATEGDGGVLHGCLVFGWRTDQGRQTDHRRASGFEGIAQIRRVFRRARDQHPLSSEPQKTLTSPSGQREPRGRRGPASLRRGLLQAQPHRPSALRQCLRRRFGRRGSRPTPAETPGRR